MRHYVSTTLPIPVVTLYEFKRFDTFQVFYCWGPFSILRISIPKIFSIDILYGIVHLRCNTSLLSCDLGIRLKFRYFISLIQKFFVGTAIGFRRYIRAKGIDHKIEQLADSSLIFTTSLTNKITAPMSPEVCTKMARKNRMLRCKTSYLRNLAGLLSTLRNAKKPNVYTGKGIRYRRDPIMPHRKQGKQPRPF